MSSKLVVTATHTHRPAENALVTQGKQQELRHYASRACYSDGSQGRKNCAPDGSPPARLVRQRRRVSLPAQITILVLRHVLQVVLLPSLHRTAMARHVYPWKSIAPEWDILTSDRRIPVVFRKVVLHACTQGFVCRTPSLCGPFHFLCIYTLVGTSHTSLRAFPAVHR